jgi:hypothetical protein
MITRAGYRMARKDSNSHRTATLTSGSNGEWASRLFSRFWGEWWWWKEINHEYADDDGGGGGGGVGGGKNVSVAPSNQPASTYMIKHSYSRALVLQQGPKSASDGPSPDPSPNNQPCHAHVR